MELLLEFQLGWKFGVVLTQVQLAVNNAEQTVNTVAFVFIDELLQSLLQYQSLTRQPGAFLGTKCIV